MIITRFCQLAALRCATSWRCVIVQCIVWCYSKLQRSLNGLFVFLHNFQKIFLLYLCSQLPNSLGALKHHPSSWQIFNDEEQRAGYNKAVPKFFLTITFIQQHCSKYSKNHQKSLPYLFQIWKDRVRGSMDVPEASKNDQRLRFESFSASWKDSKTPLGTSWERLGGSGETPGRPKYVFFSTFLATSFLTLNFTRLFSGISMNFPSATLGKSCSRQGKTQIFTKIAFSWFSLNSIENGPQNISFWTTKSDI